MRATIRQVAERAGVSRSTVSNVLLERHGEASAETREAVLKAVRELDYLPVRPVLQNRATKSHVLSLVLNDHTQFCNEFHAQNCAGMGYAALNQGYKLLALLRPDPIWANDRQEVGLLDRRSDGIIILSTETDEKIVFEALGRRNMPTVVCYRRDVPEGVIWADPNNRQAMFDAVAHLRQANHTQIAHLNIEIDFRFDYRERFLFFIEAVREYGIPESANNIIEASIESIGNGNPVATEIAQQIMNTGATAIVCANDWLALRLWDVFQEMGVRVPEDISLVGIDNVAESQWRGLTTMGFSFFDVGRCAVEGLIEHLEGREAAQCNREIPLQLCERKSVRRL